MKIFFAYPFTQLIESKTGLCDDTTVGFINTVIRKFNADGHSVFSAHLREKFGEEIMDAKTATRLDYDEMVTTDMVVAFPGQFPISGGVHVEMGWASALKKPIVLLLHAEQQYSPMIEGLHTVTNVKYIRFNHNYNENDIISLIFNSVDEMMVAL